jgi:hypothetical protein
MRPRNNNNNSPSNSNSSDIIRAHSSTAFRIACPRRTAHWICPSQQWPQHRQLLLLLLPHRPLLPRKRRA